MSVPLPVSVAATVSEPPLAPPPSSRTGRGRVQVRSGTVRDWVAAQIKAGHTYAEVFTLARVAGVNANSVYSAFGRLPGGHEGRPKLKRGPRRDAPASPVPAEAVATPVVPVPSSEPALEDLVDDAIAALQLVREAAVKTTTQHRQMAEVHRLLQGLKL